MEAAAIPFPRPERTPPVTMMYLVGIGQTRNEKGLLETLPQKRTLAGDKPRHYTSPRKDQDVPGAWKLQDIISQGTYNTIYCFSC